VTWKWWGVFTFTTQDFEGKEEAGLRDDNLRGFGGFLTEEMTWKWQP
jgi:hypothetical protein